MLFSAGLLLGGRAGWTTRRGKGEKSGEYIKPIGQDEIYPFISIKYV